MVLLKHVIDIYTVARELGTDEEGVERLVSSGILMPYVCQLQTQQGFNCIKYYGKSGEKVKDESKRKYFEYDWRNENNLCFDCREVQAYIEAQNAIKIPDGGVCGKPDPAFKPRWKLQEEILPLDRTPRQQQADLSTLATVAGWLEVAKVNKEKTEKIETLTVGLEWLRGDCTQEKAYHAYHGDTGKLNESEKQWERKRRNWFVQYAAREGLDLSYLLQNT